jgi:NADP-dependent 3-hydroxy acid dehydrogenase YdfG
MSKIVFITGATSGIGKACAEKFAAAGYDLIITGRRNERLLTLKQNLEEKFNTKVLTLNFNVQDKETVFATLNNLDDQWKKIDVLINNAGLSLGRDSFLDADIEDWDNMMQTNVNGLLYVTKALLPFLIESKAHIFNMGSIAGKEVYENGNVYCASKFAVDAISRSMRVDLLKFGIKVTAIHPGAVETEFSVVRYKGDKEKADQVYKGLKPLTGEDIASIIYFTASLPQHICINELSVTPVQQASTYYFHRES